MVNGFGLASIDTELTLAAAPAIDAAGGLSMFKASSVTVSRTSLTKFADDLPDELHEAFFRGVPNDEMRRTIFSIDRAVMKESLARRIITAKDGVIISAPAETVGKSVELKNRGTVRIVSYTGPVEKERVVRGRRERAKGAKP